MVPGLREAIEALMNIVPEGATQKQRKIFDAEELRDSSAAESVYKNSDSCGL